VKRAILVVLVLAAVGCGGTESLAEIRWDGHELTGAGRAIVPYAGGPVLWFSTCRTGPVAFEVVRSSVPLRVDMLSTTTGAGRLLGADGELIDPEDPSIDYELAVLSAPAD
jgi:hypothetical protein